MAQFSYGWNPTCPIDACPTTAATGGPVYAYGAMNSVTSMAANWEIGFDVSLLDQTGSGSQIADSSASPGAKVSGYFGIMQTKTGGPAWSLNTNLTRNALPYVGAAAYGLPGTGKPGSPGAVASSISSVGIETDINNLDQTSTDAGLPFVVGNFITGSSTFTSLSAIMVGGNFFPNAPMWRYGLDFTPAPSGGSSSVMDAEILGNSSSKIGYQLTGNHATASIYDLSTGKYAFWNTGTKSVEVIDMTDNTPVGIGINGSRLIGIHLNSSASMAGLLDEGQHGGGVSYDDRSSGAGGINLEGTYGYSALNTQNATTQFAMTAKAGQLVCFSGTSACVVYDGTKLLYTTGNKRLFSIDDQGNLTLAGKITQNGSP